MTALVAMLGLLPASLATGLGSDVQRPLATVIVWGLSSSTLLTLFVVPAFYRIFVPPLPKPRPAAVRGRGPLLVEPCPTFRPPTSSGLLEHLNARGGQQDVFHICERPTGSSPA